VVELFDRLRAGDLVAEGRRIDIVGGQSAVVSPDLWDNPDMVLQLSSGVFYPEQRPARFPAPGPSLPSFVGLTLWAAAPETKRNDIEADTVSLPGGRSTWYGVNPALVDDPAPASSPPTPDPAKVPLRNASIAEIHEAIDEVYDRCEEAKMMLPNIILLPKAVTFVLEQSDRKSPSVKQIRTLANEKRHDKRRLNSKSGETAKARGLQAFTLAGFKVFRPCET
jgi:hypothetical protein